MASKKKFHGDLLSWISILGVSSLLFSLLVFRSFEYFSFANASVEDSINNLESAITVGVRKARPLHLPILVYHYVEVVKDERDTIRKTLSITPQTFESQLLTLLTHGYEPVTMSQVSDYFENNQDLPQKPIVLTFDDGYRDFYTDVLPLLKRYHIPAVLYMSSGFLDSTPNYLTTEQLLDISHTHLVEINAHTVNHPDLRHVPLSLARYEITGGKIALEKLIGQPVEHFAYPFGAYSSSLAQEVEKAGFKTSVTTDPGTMHTYQARYIMKRIRPGSLTGSALLDFIQKP